MKDRIFRFIESSVPQLLELETELTRRPAVSPDSGGRGELDKCVFLESWLRSHGIEQLERYDAPDSRADGGIRPNLIATLPGGEDALPDSEDEGRLWIMSHIDVVPPGEASLWEHDPWQLVERQSGTGPGGKALGRHIIGRGVEDNQQGLCSSVLAALALQDAGVRPRRTVKLLFAADEENGSAYGIVWLVKNHRNLFRKNDIALIPDGGDDMGASIEIAEKNLIWARFTTKGRQAHGSRPDQGANAFLAASDLAVALHCGLSEKFSARNPLFEPDYSTFQPTKKEANVPNVNTIPGEDVFCMDMRVLPCYPVKEVLAEVDRIKAGIEAKYGVRVSYTTPQCLESPPTSAEAPLVQALSRCVEEVYRVKTKPIGIGGGTVGSCLRREGIDSAVWCRIDETAHQPNEYALIDNILGDAKVMALLMMGEG
ncbi:MAG: M20 family metallo-hydrolase [Spirochaetaceae bacterium]|jgi:succinyl-diaminopimelate desuccinylase|nr:M20 family metallo-hydrolase [Spirochaetaceae bacterium]